MPMWDHETTETWIGPHGWDQLNNTGRELLNFPSLSEGTTFSYTP